MQNVMKQRLRARRGFFILITEPAALQEGDEEGGSRELASHPEEAPDDGLLP